MCKLITSYSELLRNVATICKRSRMVAIATTWALTSPLHTDIQLINNMDINNKMRPICNKDISNKEES